MKLGRRSPPIHVEQRVGLGSDAKVVPSAHNGVASVTTEVKPVVVDVVGGSTGLDAPPQGGTAAARELLLHAVELGVPVTGDVAGAIQAAELVQGQTTDTRVTAADMERAVARSKRAEHLKASPQTDLFGFTRVVDAKVPLTSASLGALVSGCGDEAALLVAIDQGPPGGGTVWARPGNPVELIASLVRQIALGDGASKQLAVAPELSRWLDETLAAAGFSPKKAMGGAGAFAANLAAAVGADARFFSAEQIPEAIADRFAPGVTLVDKAGARHAPDAFADQTPARVNLSLEYGAGLALELCGRTSVRVNGADVALVPGGNSRVIVGALAKDVRPGLQGVDDATLTKLAKDTDLFFFVGAHYLTQAPSEQAAAEEAKKLAAALATMKKANPALVIHAQYVVPKAFENEPVVWGALKGALDSLALNVVEVAPFVDALVDGGLCQGKRSTGKVPVEVPREAAEDPLHMLEGALMIADGLSLPRVHLHGLEGDLVVSAKGTPGAKDPERQTLALVKARQLAANKAANDTGEIKSADDVWPVVPSVRGTGLAALHRFADALQARFGLSDRERALVVERWWWQNPADGTVIHFVPSRGIHDRTGGTVSLGDTIDASALMFALEGRAPKLKHGSSFR
ncbi:MAG: hypothetical protein HYS27_01140 [Deltaproteobacteria bacterium]|nr:hypothetical protein [Deltaproteobacteria bacterium]